MIIDVHCHMGTSWLGWKTNEIGPERLLELYDELGVDKICLSAWQVSYDFKVGNKEIYDICKKHPDRFIQFAIIAPRDRKLAIEELERSVNEYGAKGLKIHPSINQFMVDSTLIDPVMEKAVEYKLPILFHSEEDGYSHPRMLSALAERYPSVTMIIGHMGGTAWLEAVEAAKKHKNVYLDTTEMLNDGYIIGDCIEQCGAEKIVWGSDSPILNMFSEYAKVKYSDRYGNVTEKDKEMIFGLNMQRVLGIK